MTDDNTVLVAGGGIGGLAVANSLLHAGVPVVVLEQAAELTEIGAAIGVQTNAVRALRHIGLADRLIGTGVPIEYYEYYSWRGRRLVRWSQGEIGRRLGEPTVVVHRADLQRTLLQSLRERGGDGVLRLGQRVAEYSEDESGVTVTLSGGERVRGGFLVGADGLRSGVRSQLLGDDPLRYSGWVAYRAVTHYADKRFPVGFARQTLGRGRTFGMWHLPDGRVYWVATVVEPQGGDVPTDARKDYVLDLFGSAHQPIAELVKQTDDAVILRNEVSDRKPVDRWSSTRVALLGDAAHPTTPVTGQGGGQAIIDAHVLGEALGRVGLGDNARLREALAEYETRRRPVTASITNEAWRIAGMHHVGNPVATTGRDLSLQLQPARVWNGRMEQRLAF
jgi:2-polyprenyl-6-methoxyphenol hydroxylase-like FAD-dependent oxidoreductase